MSKGHDRERLVRRQLEADGWWTCRAAGSLGDADIVALRQNSLGVDAMLVEVKANKDGGPYMNFRPEDRAELVAAAEKAGAEAYLCYWPPHGKPQWLSSDEWPEAKAA